MKTLNPVVAPEVIRSLARSAYPYGFRPPNAGFFTPVDFLLGVQYPLK
jgi:hypothetical protein